MAIPPIPNPSWERFLALLGYVVGVPEHWTRTRNNNGKGVKERSGFVNQSNDITRGMGD